MNKIIVIESFIIIILISGFLIANLKIDNTFLRKEIIIMNNNSVDMLERYDKLARCKLYDVENEELTYVNGVYYHQEYFCVWTAGRTLEDINATFCHEVAHHLIAEGECYQESCAEHFCGDYCK